MLEMTWLVILIIMFLTGHVLWGVLMIVGLPVLLGIAAILVVLFDSEGGRR